MQGKNPKTTCPLHFADKQPIPPQGNQGLSQGTTDPVVNSPILPSMQVNISPNAIPNGGFQYPAGPFQPSNPPIVNAPYGSTTFPQQQQEYTALYSYEQAIQSTGLPYEMQSSLIYHGVQAMVDATIASQQRVQAANIQSYQKELQHIHNTEEQRLNHELKISELDHKLQNDLEKANVHAELNITKPLDKCNITVHMLEEEGKPLKARITFVESSRKREVTPINVLKPHIVEYYSDSGRDSIFSFCWISNSEEKQLLLTLDEFNVKSFLTRIKQAGIPCKSLPSDYREEVYAHLIDYLYQWRTKVLLYEYNGWNATPSGMHFVRLTDVSMEKLRRCLENERNKYDS